MIAELGLLNKRKTPQIISFPGYDTQREKALKFLLDISPQLTSMIMEMRDRGNCNIGCLQFAQLIKIISRHLLLFLVHSLKPFV
jgi:hypothetical protein